MTFTKLYLGISQLQTSQKNSMTQLSSVCVRTKNQEKIHKYGIEQTPSNKVLLTVDLQTCRC